MSLTYEPPIAAKDSITRRSGRDWPAGILCFQFVGKQFNTRLGNCQKNRGVFVNWQSGRSYVRCRRT